MKKTVLTPIVICLLVSCVLVWPNAPAAYPNDGENWTISTAETLTDVTKLPDHVTIQNGGSLTLDGVTLDAGHDISINSGGTLNAVDSNITVGENFTVDGTLILENTTVRMNYTESSTLIDITDTAIVNINGSRFMSVKPDIYYNVHITGQSGQASNVQITNTSFKHLGHGSYNDFGIYVAYADDVIFHNLTVEDVNPDADGFNLAGIGFYHCDRSLISGCTFNITGQQVRGLRIYIGCNDATIVNNTFRGGLSAIYVDSSWDYPANRTLIKNNHVMGAFSEGLNLTGYTRNTMVENNTVENCSTRGMMLYTWWLGYPPDPQPNFWIYNNTIINNGKTGVECRYEARVHMIGNTVAHNGGAGLYAVPFMNRVTTHPRGYGYTMATDNRFVDNEVGVRLYGKNGYIYDNEIRDNDQEGILAEVIDFYTSHIDPTNPDIRGNTISGNGADGIRSIGAYTTSYKGKGIVTSDVMSPQNEIEGNTITGNGGNGIFLDASPAIMVNNQISGNAVEDLNLTYASHATSINTTFGTGDPAYPTVYFNDINSDLKISWYLDVMVEDGTGVPVPDAAVGVRDGTGGTPVNDQTDGAGHSGTHVLPEMLLKDTDSDKRGNPESSTNYNPYNITASKAGHRSAATQFDLDTSKNVTLVLVKNIGPLPVTDIRPAVTHNLTPTLGWDPVIDPEGDPITYYVNIGTTAGSSDIMDNSTGSTVNTNFAVSSGLLDYGPAALGNYSRTYYLAVWSDDGMLGIGLKTGTLTVYNNAPTKPVGSLEPQNPLDGDDIVCTLDQGPHDLDGDPVAYNFEWSRDGELQNDHSSNGTSASATLPASATARGEVWSCTARVFDTFTWGAWSDPVEVTVSNNPPVSNSTHPALSQGITLCEDGVAWLDMSQIFTDDDDPFDDLLINITPKNSGADHISFGTMAVNHSVRITPDPNWHGLETYTITASIRDQSASADLNVTVSSVNDAPQVETVGDETVVDNAAYFRGSKGALEGSLFTVNLTVSDVDVELGESDDLDYSVNATWASITAGADPATATLHFTPTLNDTRAGKVMVTVIVTSTNHEGTVDAVTEDHVDLKIDVINRPDAPVILTVNGIDVVPGETVELTDDDGAFEDMPFHINVTAEDPDFSVISEKLDYTLSGDAISKQFSQNHLDDDGKSVGWILEADQDDVGEATITINVTDKKMLGDQVDVHFTITNTNDPPSEPSFTFKQEPGSLNITFSAVAVDDPDPGSEITYTWDFGDGDDESGKSMLNVTHRYTEAGTYMVNLTVSDGEAGSSAEFEVVVQAVDTTPGDDDTTGDGDDADADEDKGDEGGFPWWILLVIAAVVAVLVIFLLTRKKEDEEEKENDEEGKPPEEEETPPETLDDSMYAQDYAEADAYPEGEDMYDEPPAEDFPMDEDEIPEVDEEVPGSGEAAEGDDLVDPIEESDAPLEEDELFAPIEEKDGGV